MNSSVVCDILSVVNDGVPVPQVEYLLVNGTARSLVISGPISWRTSVPMTVPHSRYSYPLRADSDYLLAHILSSVAIRVGYQLA